MSDDDVSASQPSSYALPDQHPRIDPPSRDVPEPVAMDGELSRLETTSLDIDETMLAALDLQRIAGWRWRQDPAASAVLYRLEIAAASLVGKDDPVSEVRARWVANLLKK